MTRLLVVRHGQTAWNARERFRGRADIPLDETGLRQAAATGRWIAAHWQPTALYTSPLSRAVATGEAIAVATGLTGQVHRGLVDIDYGEWQGLTPEEVAERWPRLYYAWYNVPEEATIPGGESLTDLRRRGLATVEELVQRHPRQTLVLVGHTVINRVILLALMRLGNDRFWRIRQDTCAINVIEAEAGDYTIVSLNDTCHLRAGVL